MLSKQEPDRNGSNKEEEKAKKNNRKRGRAHLDNDVPGSAGHRGEEDSRS